jgi:hypothetical protein
MTDEDYEMMIANKVIDLIAEEVIEIWERGKNEVSFDILTDGQVQICIRGEWCGRRRIESFMLNGPFRLGADGDDTSWPPKPIQPNPTKPQLRIVSDAE